MGGRLVACSSCAVHVKASESQCPYCGSEVRSELGRAMGRATGAVLVGLALASCQIEPEYGVALTATTGTETDSATGGDTGTTTGEGTSSTAGDDGTTVTGSAATSGSSSSTGGESDTDGTSGGTSSTGISPDYGVPTTGESWRHPWYRVGMALTACPSCSLYVHREENGCPHCGAELDARSNPVARTAAAVLMGLTLAGCPANDETEDSVSSSAAYGVPTTDTMNPSAGSTTGDGTGTTEGSDSTSGGTDSSSSSGTASSSTGEETDTDGTSTGAGDTGSTGSTGISPDYGVPSTSGE